METFICILPLVVSNSVGINREIFDEIAEMSNETEQSEDTDTADTQSNDQGSDAEHSHSSSQEDVADVWRERCLRK